MSNSKDSQKKYSVAAYAWLMFITDYYRRVSDLDLNFDEMMTLNTVVTQWLYKVNTQEPKSRQEIHDMTDLEIGKHFQGSRLSVLSIANIKSCFLKDEGFSIPSLSACFNSSSGFLLFSSCKFIVDGVVLEMRLFITKNHN